MKKIISICFITVLLGLCLSGCKTKRTAVDKEKFVSIMEEQGYEVQEITDQYSSEDVEAVVLALKDEYQIEFYDVASEEQAVSAFNTNKSDFEEEKGSASSDKSVSVGNYAYYSLNSNGKFYYVSRIDNTFIYVVTDNSYKNEIETVMKELGY